MKRVVRYSGVSVYARVTGEVKAKKCSATTLSRAIQEDWGLGEVENRARSILLSDHIQLERVRSDATWQH